MTTTWMLETEELVEGRKIRLGKRPITFERFLDMTDEDDDFELVKGALIPKMSAQYPHENRFGWLHAILRTYVRRKKLGTVLGSRSAVEIDKFGGRLPDILFIRSDREDIIRDKAIYGAPDLIIELVSPSTSRTELNELRADYQQIGVSEIVFWYADEPRVVVLRRADEDYTEEILTSGEFRSQVVPGFHIDVGALAVTPLPDELGVLELLLAEPG